MVNQVLSVNEKVCLWLLKARELNMTYPLYVILPLSKDMTVVDFIVTLSHRNLTYREMEHV